MTSDRSIGSATVASADQDSAVSVRTDGEVLERTLELLVSGQSGTRAMPQQAVERLREEAAELVSALVNAYDAEVATGEVGSDGSARASDAPPRVKCPTGLLYGRIQSGKTAAMIVTTAMALDNGFRVVVVLTSNYEKLVDQTASRFRVLAVDGPLLCSSNERTGTSYVWDSDAENIARHLGEHGLVVVCAKNPAHQRALLRALREIGADRYPALILDDEADQATPDTTLNSRTQQRAGAPQQASTTYRLTVESDSAEELESFREVLRHNVYLQVTATPYALLLQNVSSPLRPTFTKLLRPGDGYTGGEQFFSAAQVTPTPFSPPLVAVDEDESAVLESADAAPEGLRRAICFFLLAAAAHSQRRAGSTDLTGYKFLCHTSPRMLEHDRLNRMIREFVDGLFEASANRATLEWAYRELLRTVPDAPTLDELVEAARRRIHYRRILTVNASGSSLEFGPAANFIVGGNILGRGLTIDNLLVTYYLRRAKTTQMDTMLQHARMYGYRGDLMRFTRVFLPETLAMRFARIHDAETSLRSLLTDPDSLKRVPVQVAGQLRPTRPGVLDVGSIAAYTPGQQVYPSEPKYTAEDLGNSSERIWAVVQREVGGEPPRGEFVRVSIDAICEIIETARSHDEELGDWDQEAIVRVLRCLSPKYGGSGLLRTRASPTRMGPRLPSGVLSGPDQTAARGTRKPVLYLSDIAGEREKGWAGVRFWYPTLVFPSDMDIWLFNVTRR